jgi:hypothetical protein
VPTPGRCAVRFVKLRVNTEEFESLRDHHGSPVPVPVTVLWKTIGRADFKTKLSAKIMSLSSDPAAAPLASGHDSLLASSSSSSSFVSSSSSSSPSSSSSSSHPPAPPQFKTYGRRWFMLLIFSALALCNNLAWCVRRCTRFFVKIFVVWLSDIFWFSLVFFMR